MMCEASPPTYPLHSVGEREVSKSILGFLDKKELLAARTVNKTWKKFISENVWPKDWDPVELYPQKVSIGLPFLTVKLSALNPAHWRQITELAFLFPNKFEKTLQSFAHPGNVPIQLFTLQCFIQIFFGLASVTLQTLLFEPEIPTYQYTLLSFISLMVLWCLCTLFTSGQYGGLEITFGTSCIIMYCIGRFSNLDYTLTLVYSLSSFVFYYHHREQIKNPEKEQLETIFGCLLFCCSIEWIVTFPLISIFIANGVLFQGQPLATVIQRKRPIIFGLFVVGYCGYLAWTIHGRILNHKNDIVGICDSYAGSGVSRGATGSNETLVILLSAFGPAFLYQLASLICLAGIKFDLHPIYPGDRAYAVYWMKAHILSGLYFPLAFGWNLVMFWSIWWSIEPTSSDSSTSL